MIYAPTQEQSVLAAILQRDLNLVLSKSTNQSGIVSKDTLKCNNCGKTKHTKSSVGS